MKVLIAMLQDEDVVQRWVAAQALGQLWEISAVEPLVAALCDEEENEREAAEDPLGSTADPGADQALAAYGEQRSKN